MKIVFQCYCNMAPIHWNQTIVDVRLTSWLPNQTAMASRKFWRIMQKIVRNSFLLFLKLSFCLASGEHHPNLQLKSPDKPHEKSILQPSPNTPQNPNLLMTSNMAPHHGHHATTSTQSSNFYENTMHSDTSSAKKRKSVISSQSTGSSNEVCIRNSLSITQ